VKNDPCVELCNNSYELSIGSPYLHSYSDIAARLFTSNSSVGLFIMF